MALQAFISFWKTAGSLARLMIAISGSVEACRDRRVHSLRQLGSSVAIRRFVGKVSRRSRVTHAERVISTLACIVRLRYHVFREVFAESARSRLFAILKETSAPFEVLHRLKRVTAVCEVVYFSLVRFIKVKRRFKEEAKQILDRTLNRIIVWEEINRPGSGFSQRAVKYYQQEKQILSGFFELCYLRYLRKRTEGFKHLNFEHMEQVLKQKNEFVFELCEREGQEGAEDINLLWNAFNKFNQKSMARKTFFFTADYLAEVAGNLGQPDDRQAFRFNFNAKETYFFLYNYLSS